MDRVFPWPPKEHVNVPDNYIGVTIKRQPDGGWHTGVLYCTSQRGAYVLHLMRHYSGTKLKSLINEYPQDNTLCVLCVVDAVQIPALARVFRDIYAKNKNPGLPYGFTPPLGKWFGEDSLLIPVPPGQGLCCQTFVLAAFQAADLPLIDPAEAPPRADDYVLQRAFFDKNIGSIQDASPRSQEHFAVVNANLGTAIYRPLEVVGAAKADNLPCSFTEAQANGNDLEPLIPPAVVLATAAETVADDTAVALPDATSSPVL